MFSTTKIKQKHVEVGAYTYTLADTVFAKL